MRVVLKRLAIAVVAVVLAAVAGFAAFAPYVSVEVYSWSSYPTVFEPPKPGTGSDAGEVRWFDGYYAVERIDDRTYAIGEPRYY